MNVPTRPLGFLLQALFIEHYKLPCINLKYIWFPANFKDFSYFQGFL